MIFHNLRLSPKIVFEKVHSNLFYLFVCVLLYTPLLILYLSESSGGFTLSALILPLVISLFTLLIPTMLGLKWRKCMQWLDTLFIGPVIYVFVVVTFFPLQGGALDGRDIDLSTTTVWIYSGFIIATLTISILLLIFKKINLYFQRSVNIIGIITISMSTYFAISIIPVSNNLKEASQYADLFGKNDNIIVIMLDMVQSDFAKECLNQNKDVEEAFEGFTFYQNTASFAASTALSYSGLMRGGIPVGVGNVKLFNYRNNLLEDMTEKEYLVNYHSVMPYRLKNKKIITIPEEIGISQRNKYFSFSLLCSRRYIPYTISFPWFVKEHGWMAKYDNKLFFEWLISNARVSDVPSKKFLWYHTTLTHTPIRFRRDGSFSLDLTPDDTIGEIFYAFSLVADFIKRLKDLNIYNDSLIIILSDHGYNTLGEINNLPPGKNWYLTELDDTVSSSHPLVNLRVGQYSPLLMIKAPNSTGKLKISNTTASLLDIRKTLNEYALPGSGKNMFGLNLLDENNSKVNREVPIIKFVGETFKSEDFFNTEKYVIDSLKLPFDKNYKTIKYSYKQTNNASEAGVRNNIPYAIVLDDLTRIASALNAYHEKHDVYPKSEGFDGIYSNYGFSGKDWIKDLTPSFIEVLPRDPRMLEDPDRQYFYNSNGDDYKLIAHNGPQFTEVKKFYPKMIDPMRQTTSYGVWTKGAAKW